MDNIQWQEISVFELGRVLKSEDDEIQTKLLVYNPTNDFWLPADLDFGYHLLTVGDQLLIEQIQPKDNDLVLFEHEELADACYFGVYEEPGYITIAADDKDDMVVMEPDSSLKIIGVVRAISLNAGTDANKVFAKH